MSSGAIFIIEDKLPLISEVIMALLKGYKSRNDTSIEFNEDILVLSKFLVNEWSKIFGDKTMLVSNVVYHIKNKFKVYENHIGKKGKGVQSKAFLQWRNENDILFDLLRNHELNEIQNEFYLDQKGGRNMKCSDVLYRIEQSAVNPEDSMDLDDTDNDHVSMNESSNDSSPSSSSPTSSDDNDSSYDEENHDDSDCDVEHKGYNLRSGVVFDDLSVNYPEIHLREGSKNFNEKVLRTMIALTTIGNCTVPQSRIVFHLVSNLMFNQSYQLESDEKTVGVPRSETDFLNYQNVVPSSTILYRHLHTVALQREFECANEIRNAPSETLITIGYDSTSRSGLKNEWVSFVVHFSDREEKYRLRPLYLAFENRANAASIFVEQFKRLGFLCNIEPKNVYEQINAIMTDSVSKMLGIEDLIADQLRSYHKPYHLLCVSHTVEGFTRAQTEVILEVCVSDFSKKRFFFCFTGSLVLLSIQSMIPFWQPVQILGT